MIAYIAITVGAVMFLGSLAYLFDKYDDETDD